MASADVDTVVIGAGVVGLAVARAMAMRGKSVVVLEREKHIGQGISARNSEVIHAGIYYKTGSLKARLCVRGKHLLYQYCEERSIPFKRIGKLIVATEQSDVATLHTLHQTAIANGVDDLIMLSGTEAQAMQPDLTCMDALHSPSTGIVDSHALMMSLQADIESHRGDVVCQAEVARLDYISNLLRVTLNDNSCVTATQVVNCSGLNSIALANTINRSSDYANPSARLAKGNYFKLAAKAPFSTLIYPAPVVGGLGIHLTIDLAGQNRFGPDVEWLEDQSPDAINYRVDADRGAAFYQAIRKYWPELPDNSLVPDYAGVRPKIARNGSVEIDFEISTEQHHGIAGLVNLFGIESPGLTASLAIAETVCHCLHA